MEQFIELVKSDVGVTLAWLCSVGSAAFAIFKRKENKALKIKVKNLTNIVTTDNSQDIVNQDGQKNVYTKNNSGGMNIKM
jgi:hypothetical protein